MTFGRHPRHHNWDFCQRCGEYTYWTYRRCKRCLQHRRERIRSWILAGACILAFIVAIAHIFWSGR